MVAEGYESDSNASFLRAARAGNLEKVLEYLKGSIDINTSNANGLNALHLSSKEGHVAVVTELVKRGANVNAATKKGNTALHIASLAGQEEVIKILIRNGANANVQSQNGFTPLYMAAQENHDGVVKFLLANSANQSLATEDGFTPLAVALQQGHDKVVAVLLENDTKGRVRLPALHIAAKKDDCKAAALLLQSDHDPDVTSKSGFTPLHIAAHYGNENIATLLLEKNADVNFSAKHQITPLHVAAKWGKSNMVTLLIDKGAKIDASTRDGLTPLHCAARSGHEQVVDLLLEKGAPITAKTKNGLAPLHMASQGDHVDSARILLYHKAPVDDVTVDYLTALHVAAHCGHVRVAKLLLDRKADANARALNGFTPLHIACKKNRIKVVELLLKHGASIEATTESGLTPLHVASFMGCMNIVIYLIQHGANPDVPTIRGETPLHLAARANQSDIIRILLRNGAHVDASAREEQTPLHIAARLGNVDIVGLLLQHGAAVDAPTKDMYTALHIAAKEGQEEVASVLLDHGASLTATTKKGFTPLHLAAKYGNIKVARLLLQKDAPVDAQGKNGVTPLHVAAHYDHVNVALLLLDKGAFPHATAKNGYTPLHIAAKKNQMDIATTLLEYGAKPSAESKAGFTPLHLAAQEGHTDMTTLLIEHHADANSPAKNGLSPLHLCAQEDKVNVAAILVKNGAKVDPPTKAGYTPLHVACHFGQINMIRFLLQHGADVNATTSHGYTPLHQAAQQGHTLIINLLLEHKASPNTTTNQGQTALSIAQRLGYISVVETLKIVTETIVTTTTTTVTEEKYKVVAPETMQETFMSDSEDEGADDTMMGDQSLHYMTTDELKALADDNTLGIDVTRDERGTDSTLIAPLTAEEDHLTPQHVIHQESTFSSSITTDNVDLTRPPIHAGFLVSFMVDARGGAMRGCRHSGVRVIIPPRKAPMPMRITCRYLRKEKLAYPPPLMEGEACASRILEVGPSGAKFLGPVIIEVPHFASLRGREREITILRSDNGESWREHTLEASDDAVHDVFNESFEGEELTAVEDLSTNRITRILTTDFPQYFAIITRIRQEVHAIGPEGGMVSSTVVPQVQAIFPEGALTKKIKVGLQAHPITPELVTKLLGNRVAVSPIVTVEPRRRKFHKPITLTIPVPQAATKGMINQYSGDAPTLRLLCSITGGTTKAQWEDVTGSTPLTFVNDCVSFTTTVSARFWLMDCRQVNEATKFATELYREAIHVPFMAKFVVFAKRHDPLEAQLRVFCMTDDKEDKTLESQEHFTEVAKSRDVEVLEGKSQYLEFAGNLVPVTKSGEQLCLTFQAFRENRLPFTIRVKDPHQEPMGRVAFMREPRVGRGEPPQSPICNLNIVLPEADLTPVSELVTLEKKYGFVQETSLAKPELIHRADLRLSDIAKELKDDWVSLALQLDLPESDINSIRSDNPNDSSQQALVMLRHWLQRSGSKATGNMLEKGLRKINREDIVNQCMFNVEIVTDDVEKAVAKVHLDQSGFDTFKEELGSSRDASLRRDTSLNGAYDEQDIMKEAESAAETSSESSDKEAHFRSEARHSDNRTENVSHFSHKGSEEGPETLVQNVPTALAESFTQNLSNGQLSDTSVHEDDKSEPTVATLSSEATAEMEVSSLEDKSQSQTETHVEKKERLGHYGTRKYASGSHSQTSATYKTFIPRNVKLYKKVEDVIQKEMPSRKMSAKIYSRTMTPPVSCRKKRLITRRNSWPSDSPQKLNKRKKYQQRLKVRDFHEPFWTNSFEWLILRRAPENLRSAPLAYLVEFEDEGITKPIAPKLDYSCVPYGKFPALLTKEKKLNQVSLSSFSKCREVLSFYFVHKSFQNLTPKNNKISLDRISSRCIFESLKSCTVRSLKTTNFADAASNEDVLPNSVKHIFSGFTENHMSTFTNPIIATDANVSMDNFVLYEYQESEFDCRANASFQEYKPVNTHGRSFQRPLQSYNTESLGDVLICNPATNVDNFNCVKRKIVFKDSFRNKENILKGNVNAKFYVERVKKPITSGQNFKTNQKAITSFIPIENNRVIEKRSHVLPKIVQIKSNKQDITGCEQQDMLSSSSSTSKKGKPPAEKNSSSTTSTSLSSTDEVKDSNPQLSGESEQSTGQSSKPYLRQLFEKDIQSNFSKSSKKSKEPEKKSERVEPSLLSEETVEADAIKISTLSESKKQDPIPGEDHRQAVSDKLSAAPRGPQRVLEQDEEFLKSLKERVHEESVKEASFPASVIGHAFLNTLIQQQNILQKDTPAIGEQTTTSMIGHSSMKTLDEESTLHKKANEQPVPAVVIGQAFLKNLMTSENMLHMFESEKPMGVSESVPLTDKEQSSCGQPIPASVINQAFLKSLMDSNENVQIPDVSKPIPASVVGQSFLKALVSQQQENENPCEITEAGTLTSAAVQDQPFHKKLIEREKGQLQGHVEGSTPKTVPAPVISQAFLKTMLDIQSNVQNVEMQQPFPASVVGQAFLQTLIKEQSMNPEPVEKKPITAAAAGQEFLKTLMTQETVAEKDGSKVFPSTVIGQTFLKSLIEEKELKHQEREEIPIPASVIGQAFLKTLTAQENPLESEKHSSKVVPSTVIGQSFVKTLIEEEQAKSMAYGEEKPIPSSVIGQAFLKTLVEQKNTASSEEQKSNIVPSTVIGQTFLKTLMEEEHLRSQELAKEKPIPATVVGQAFLKTLVDQKNTSESVEHKSNTVPSNVIGQTFLKSLLEEENLRSQEQAEGKPIPASVVGQSFLKSLVQAPMDQNPETSQNSLKENTVLGNDQSSKITPSTVIGQTFLKALVEEQQSRSKEFEKETIPASIIGQTFLKTLVEHESIANNEQSSKLIPSSVIGQTFLKTLMNEDQLESQPCGGEKVVAAAAVGQAFLKTLIGGQEVSKDEFRCAQQLPSSVTDQTATKSQEKVKVDEGKDSKDQAVPSTVVGQTFLKCLLEESCQTLEQKTPPNTTSQSLECKHPSLSGESLKCGRKGDILSAPKVEKPNTSETKTSEPISASVIGLVFLKTLTEQSEIKKPSSTETEEQSSQPLPACVVGQAFLKTLMDVTSESNSNSAVSLKPVPQVHSEVGEVKESDVGIKGFKSKMKNVSDTNDNSVQSTPALESERDLVYPSTSLSTYEEQCTIIPPPPEFSSVSEPSGATGSTVLSPQDASGIIGELLSYTKMMHSVIESMTEADTSEADSTSSKFDIRRKEDPEP